MNILYILAISAFIVMCVSGAVSYKEKNVAIGGLAIIMAFGFWHVLFATIVIIFTRMTLGI